MTELYTDALAQPDPDAVINYERRQTRLLQAVRASFDGDALISEAQQAAKVGLCVLNIFDLIQYHADGLISTEEFNQLKPVASVPEYLTDAA